MDFLELGNMCPHNLIVMVPGLGIESSLYRIYSFI